MLIPLERMRVGISSDSASQTHTPGPMAKNAMKAYSVSATSHPFCVVGIGLMSALSIRSGAAREACRLPNGLVKNALTLFSGRHASRVITIGLAARSSERTAELAARKSPHE